MGTFSKRASEFSQIPMVHTLTTAAAEMVGRESASAFQDEIGQRLSQDMPERAYVKDVAEFVFDSPLEVAFWVWWMAFRKLDHFCREAIDLLRQVEVVVDGSRYVVDFALAPNARAKEKYPGAAWPAIGIELDGHAFHEKTTEQAMRLNQRDRALQQVGWHMFHFSFKEFTEQPENCLNEVVEFARQSHWRATKDYLDRTFPGVSL